MENLRTSVFGLLTPKPEIWVPNLRVRRIMFAALIVATGMYDQITDVLLAINVRDANGWFTAGTFSCVATAVLMQVIIAVALGGIPLVSVDAMLTLLGLGPVLHASHALAESTTLSDGREVKPRSVRRAVMSFHRQLVPSSTLWSIHCATGSGIESAPQLMLQLRLLRKSARESVSLLQVATLVSSTVSLSVNMLAGTGRDLPLIWLRLCGVRGPAA